LLHPPQTSTSFCRYSFRQQSHRAAGPYITQ
jgi:hypothetical protein